MSIIIDLPKCKFDAIWDGTKPFYVLDDPQNKHELNVGYVISFRERHDKTNVLTRREISANLTHVEPIGVYSYVIGLSIYQRLNFNEESTSKRKI